MYGTVFFVSFIILTMSTQAEIFVERQALAGRRTGPDKRSPS